MLERANDDEPVVDRLASPPRPRGRTHFTSTDEQLFRTLMDRFTVLSEMCYRFSQELYLRTGGPPELDLEGTVQRNLEIARSAFGERLLDILAVTYLKQTVGFQELREILGGMSARRLAAKLQKLEELGLLQRDIAYTPTAKSRYSLTHKGMIIGRLGEPVFLYLRLASGWTKAVQPEAASIEGKEERVPSKGEMPARA